MLLALTASLVRAQTGKALTLPEKGAFIDICFSSDGTKIASRQALKPEEDEVRVYSFPSLRLIGGVGRSTQSGETNFSPSGKHLAVVQIHEKQNKICVYDVTVSPPKIVRRLSLKKPTGPYPIFPRQTRFAADGKHVFATEEVGGKSMLHGWDISVSDTPTFSFPLPAETTYLLGGDHMLVHVNRKKPAELFKFDAKGVKKVHQVNPGIRFPYLYWHTGDGKTLAFWNEKDNWVEVYGVDDGPDSKVDCMLDAWFSCQKAMLKPKERISVSQCGITNDRSVVVMVYGIQKYEERPERQGLAFFPRGPKRFAEFGLDKKRHTHLFLPLAEKISYGHIVTSPDGRWIAFTGVEPARIWQVETLGRDLLAEKAVEKR
jgi:hypothetical protein